MALSPGTRLGPYEIVAPIGAGGMGDVYRARDPRLERDVAVKVLPERFAQDETALARFQRESKALAALSHPNIVAIYDIGVDEGRTFAVMELLGGETLASRLERSALEWRKAMQIALAIADGLAATHGKGIFHRDIKPQNIFLTAGGDVKILDFGLARLESERAPAAESLTVPGTLKTKPGTILGTVQYMSPEQVRGEPADARSDIFGVGCVLYEMLTGNPAFSRPTAVESMAMILNDDPTGLAESAINAPGGELRQIVTHCLEKDPEQRFHSGRDLAFALTLVGCGAYSDPGAGVQRLEPSPGRSTPSPRSEEGPGASIAVLPFMNMSTDPVIEHFSDGLAEELINTLSKIEGLDVASRTSAFSFKGKNLDIRRIGEQLNVRTILEGSVRKAGNRLRVSAQLVNVADGYHLWSESFDREIEDVLAVQDSIAQSIALLVSSIEADRQAVGVIKSIAYRPRDGEPIRETEQCVVRVGRGLEQENRPAGKREITLLSAEAWTDTCRELGVELPWYTRRANLLVEGIDLAATIAHTVGIGEVQIKVHGETKPCDVMDGEYQGLREALVPDCRGGVYGQLLSGGTIRVGDRVSVVTDE